MSTKETPCEHVKLLVRDFANQAHSILGPCLFCQRDSLLEANERYLQALKDARFYLETYAKNLDSGAPNIAMQGVMAIDVTLNGAS
jgi:hypothetical protein